MTDRELMQQALDALCTCTHSQKVAITALRARLAQPKPKPVAKVHIAEDYYPHVVWMEGAVCFDQEYLYRTPPQREWQGLTDEKLHLQAAAYATYRKNIYIEGMKQGEVDHMSEDALNGKWLAYYEGYREGYWVATDPAKLKEKNGTI